MQALILIYFRESNCKNGSPGAIYHVRRAYVGQSQCRRKYDLESLYSVQCGQPII